MKTKLEDSKTYYVICSIDLDGKTVYIRSLHGPGKWEIVADIEKATKANTLEAAELLYELYRQEVNNGEWVIVPLIIQYLLVDES